MKEKLEKENINNVAGGVSFVPDEDYNEYGTGSIIIRGPEEWNAFQDSIGIELDPDGTLDDAHKFGKFDGTEEDYNKFKAYCKNNNLSIHFDK